MKVVRKLALFDTTNKMTVAFDVSKKSLNYYSETKGKLSATSCREVQSIEDSIQNRTDTIRDALEQLKKYSSAEGFDGLHVVCESTGVYSESLLRIAHKQQCSTAYVSGEHVYKAKVIESNDTGKDDIKDPRVIFMLSRMGKEQQYRQLPAEYQQLRELNRIYDETERRCTEMKCEIHPLIKRLFCDYPMAKDFIYDIAGQSLMKHFRFNPYRIAAVGFKTFSTTVRRNAPRVQEKTLRRLYEAAQMSSYHSQSPQYIEILEMRLRYLYDDYQAADRRRSTIVQLIEQATIRLHNAAELMPQPDPRVFKLFRIGRILGETGPLKDFSNYRLLFKYSGMNLRKRESGQFKGRLKMSKKGRSCMRGVLGKMVFGLIRKKELYGPYYHRRKTEKIPGQKLIAMIERKLLRLFFALGRRKEAFDQQRFQCCESQFKLAA